MRRRTAAVAFLAALAVAISAVPAAALERGIVYSKTVETETAGQEGISLEGGLYVLRGKRPRQLTYDPADVEPSVSRSGAIAFVRDGDLYLVRPDGSGLRQLTGGPEIDERPLFSPDGRSLVFTRRAVEKGPRDLFLVRLDGTPPQALTTTAEDELEASFSLDGRAIVFVRRLPVAVAGVNGDLYTVRFDGSGSRRMTKTPQQEFSPHYTVGGIVFGRRRALNEGAADIYAMRRDGGGLRREVVKRPGCEIAAVTPNGRTLLFECHVTLWRKALGPRREMPAVRLGTALGPGPLTVAPDNRRAAFLLYFDEISAVTIRDLRRGSLIDTAEVYDEGDGISVDPRFAW